MKIPFIILLISGCFSLAAEKITLFDNTYLSLELEVDTKASLASSDWLRFTLANKTTAPLLIDKLDYSINGFEESPDGNAQFVKGKYGSGNKYDLIHWFHDFRDLTRASQNFYIEPGESIVFWKHPSDRTALAVEASLVRSEEFCALMQITLDFSSEKISKSLDTEIPFCTQWTKYDQLEKKAMVERFESCIKDIHVQEVHSSMIALLPQLKDLHPLLDDTVLAEGIVNRSNELYDRERIWLLLVLKEKNSLENNILLEHYRTCIRDRQCRWEDDFHVYWDNRILDAFLESPLYIDKKALILELHSEKWSDSAEIKDRIFNYLRKGYTFDMTAIPGPDNFKNWYNTVKHIATSRHAALIPYFSALLSDERFFPVQDWSSVAAGKIIREEDRNKARTVYLRVCDVAYVCLLRIIGEVKVENVYKQNRVRPTVYIDNTWRGENKDLDKSVRLQNPYTVLQPSLKMAEKYYYLYDGNLARLKQILENYEKN